MKTSNAKQRGIINLLFPLHDQALFCCQAMKCVSFDIFVRKRQSKHNISDGKSKETSTFIFNPFIAAKG